MPILPYLKILRIQNAAMATGAVFLGAWIGESPLPLHKTTQLAFAALLSTGFGNVVNDIFDIETDRISHPQRPLPQGVISSFAAGVYALVLAALALFIAFSVAPVFGVATLLPLVLLLLYAVRLKGTPLAGNVIVSLLVAYALLFGALTAPYLNRLFVPALLAMLLNFTREIIKDIEDETGDREAGIMTSATLSGNILSTLIYFCSTVYLLLLFVPVQTGVCGTVYSVTIVIVALPLHVYRLSVVLRKQWLQKTALMSRLIKYEMLAGLCALSLDHLFNR